MKRWIVASTILLAAAAVVALSTRRGSTDRQDAPRSETDANASLRELRALRQEIESLKRTAHGRRVQEVTRNVAPSAATDGAPESVAEAKPADDPKQRKRTTFADLEANFASEPVDTAWSVPTVHAIQDAIRSAASGTEIVEAECATSLCRIVVRHQDGEVQRQLGLTLATVPPFNSGVVYDYDRESKPPKTTFLVVRAGRSFREKS
ncbi:MAG TPA: hypothetical protein VI072_04770 [Polyangiaceae bacterium]